MCLPDLTPPGRLPCDKILLEGNFVTFLEKYFPKATKSDKIFLENIP